MPFVSVTRLRVQAWRYLPIFFVQTFRSAWQARSAKNCLSVFVLREAHRTFWTRTVWTDASSMKSFMLSGVHRQVMPSLLVWCDEARCRLDSGFAGTSVVGGGASTDAARWKTFQSQRSVRSAPPLRDSCSFFPADWRTAIQVTP